jgi:hypothetical protein
VRFFPTEYHLFQADNVAKEANPAAKFSLAETEAFDVKIASARNLTDGEGVKRCILLTLDLKVQKRKYVPGVLGSRTSHSR